MHYPSHLGAFAQRKRRTRQRGNASKNISQFLIHSSMSFIKPADAWKVLETTVNVNTGQRSRPFGVGLLQLLTSEANVNTAKITLGDVTSINTTNGKVYKVSRTMFPRLASGQPKQGFDYCPEGGNGIMPISDEIEIKNGTWSDPVVIDDAILRCIKEGKAIYQDNYVNEILRLHLQKLGEQVAAVVVNQGFVGIHPKCDCNDAPTTIKDLPLMMANGLSINPTGEMQLELTRQNAQLDNPFVLVGGSRLSMYQRAKAIASNNELGFNASLLDIINSVFYDNAVGASAGNQNLALAIAPGALQLVTYAAHKGDFEYDFDDQVRTTTVDPWFGIEHDVLISYQKCGKEVKMTIQFGTNWAVVGLPKCWAEKDCKLDGVLDVFAFDVKCTDDGLCDLDVACGTPGTPQPTSAAFCDSAVECQTPCRALFYTKRLNAVAFGAEEIEVEDAIAIQINGLPFAVGGTFDLTTQAGANGFIVAAQAALASVGSIYAITGGWDGTGLTINALTDDTVISVVIVSAVSTDFALISGGEKEMINYYSASNASTGATLTDLAWTFPTASFNGAPNAQILGQIAIGTYSNFFTLATGDVQLIITDSSDCVDTYNATV